MDFQPVNDQMSNEWHNHAVYAQIAAYLYAENWPGFAAYFEKQSAEELTHYQKFRDFLIDRLQTPELTALPVPVAPELSPLYYFEQAYDLEKDNTAAILALDEITDENKDDPEREILESFLVWFKNEQRISERDAADSIKEVERVANDPAGLLVLDREYQEKAGK